MGSFHRLAADSVATAPFSERLAPRRQARGRSREEGVYSWALAPALRSLRAAGRFRAAAAPDFLQPRRAEHRAGPSPRRRVVFMAPSVDLC